MKIISYNLRKHSASGELVSLCERYSADVLCLQELDTQDMPDRIGELLLADSTTRNRLGLAIYYRMDRFDALETRTFSLKKSLHDRLLTPAHERLIGTRFYDREAEREVVVASFHAAPLTALNSLRRHQIHSALGELWQLGPGLPTIMVGDYNYPVFKENLSNKVKDAGYDLTLSDKRTYTRYKFFRGHFDLATSVGLMIENVETLPRGTSDHMPILVTAGYADAADAAGVPVGASVGAAAAAAGAGATGGAASAVSARTAGTMGLVTAAGSASGSASAGTASGSASAGSGRPAGSPAQGEASGPDFAI